MTRASRADDIDWFVPHQANRRIIDASADKLGIAREKVVVTVDVHGNTSAASIPLALDVAVSRRTDQARRPRDDRGDGRRLHLGRGADPLVRRGASKLLHGSKLFRQVFANFCLFSPNFRKHFFGGFDCFQWVRRRKKLISTLGAFFQIF